MFFDPKIQNPDVGSAEKVSNESDSSRKFSGRFALNAEDGLLLANKKQV